MNMTTETKINSKVTGALKLKLILSLVFILWSIATQAQQVKSVYKIDQLLERIESIKTPIVVNFWATWCKPCVQELPAFDSLQKERPEIKVLLVCIDFKEDLNTKVDPFLNKHGIQCETVLLDEVNGNDFINKIAKEWTGAIPGTLFVNGKKKFFIEKKMGLKELKEQLNKLSH